jgi:hypothetical protein
MKTIFNLLYTLIIGICMYLPVYSGTITVTGNLQKETIVYDTSKGVTVRNCDNVIIRQIPDTIISTKKYQAYPNTGQAVRFEVYRKESSLVWIQNFNETMNTISYNTTDGSFSKDLTSGSITPSRYNYVVKVFVGAEANPASEREYTLPVGGGAFPIGSVIAYLGNASTVANLEEAGWFKCDGRAVSTLTGALTTSERQSLTDVIGNNLPNLMGVFLRGLDENSSGVQDDDRGTRTGGENHANGTGTGVRSKQDEGYRSHNHTGTAAADGDHNHGGFTGGARRTDNSGGLDFAYDRRTGLTTGGGGDAASDNRLDHIHAISASGTHTHSLTINSQGGNETRPDNVAVYWLIRGR